MQSINAEEGNEPAIGPDDRIERVVILGGGTAALLAAAAFARHLPDIEVVMVRSTKMGIIGVGEGTIVTIGRFLHEYLGIDPLRFHREVHPSIKLGIQFDWGSETPYHYSFTPQYSAGLLRILAQVGGWMAGILGRVREKVGLRAHSIVYGITGNRFSVTRPGSCGPMRGQEGGDRPARLRSAGLFRRRG